MRGTPEVLVCPNGFPMHDEAVYICDACGEEIPIPVDPSAGDSQCFIEDCPVCCRPNQIRVELDETGDVRAWAENVQG